MCCSDPPPPPDLSGMTEASIEVAQLQKKAADDQLAWAKQQDVMNRATLNRVLDVQLPAMEDQAEWAKIDRARYEDKFIPMEDAFIQEAAGYDTAERRGQAFATAASDVTQQFDAQRRNALQRLESYGVDPSQTRNAALDVGVRTAQAAATVQAGTNARNRVEDIGRAMRSDAINLGKGLPTQAAAGYGAAVGAGGAAVGGANQTTGTSSSAMTAALSGYGGAQSGFGQAANIMNSGFQNEMAGFNAKQNQTAGMLQGLGAIGGMMMADGGGVPQFQQDGKVPEMGYGDGSGIDDTVPAKLSEGEYVIPADVVRKKGLEFFDKLVERYHTPADEQRSAA